MSFGEIEKEMQRIKPIIVLNEVDHVHEMSDVNWKLSARQPDMIMMSTAISINPMLLAHLDL